MQLEKSRNGLTEMKTTLLHILENNLLVAPVLAVIIFFIGGIISPKFMSAGNIGTTLSMTVLLGFAAAGQTLVVISGNEGIDLSIGAVMSLGAVLAAEIMHGQNGAIIPAVLIIITAGALIGLVNAVGIILTRVPPLVMTLAMSNVVVTIQMIYTHGTPSGQPAQIIKFLGSGRLLPFLPWLAVLGVIMTFLMWFLLRRTSFGRQLFAVGSNDHAAYLSGVRINLVRGLAYVLSGILSGMAGFWLTAYNNFAFVNMGASYLLPAVAAVVIGGTSLTGGKGSYTGSMLGALVLTVLGSLLVILDTDEAGRQIINGILLIILLALYTRQPAIRQ